MSFRKWFIVAAILAGSAAANGTVEYSAGQGSNSAVLSLDFDGVSIFNFDYMWDGSATTWDALAAIDAAGALNVTAEDWGSMGMLINTISYPGGNTYNYPTYACWMLAESADGQNWAWDMEGASFNFLHNGDRNTWVWTDFDEYWAPIRLPGQMPTPEPATVALIGFGALLLRGGRK
jgi:hypothetical protein